MQTVKYRAWDGSKMCKVKSIKFGILNGVMAELEGHEGKYTTLKFDKLMLYIGLPDKNGTEICEGDILKQFYQGHEIIAPMIFYKQKAQFGLEAEVDFETKPHIEIEVPKNDPPEIIGNIWENPELLKK